MNIHHASDLSSITSADCTIRLLETCLKFRVSLSPDEAELVLKGFSPYNCIPKDIGGLIHRIKDRVGPIEFATKDNPNNGKWGNIAFEIGNEGSLVIYVIVRPSYRRGVDKRSPLEIASYIQNVGKDMGADEVNIQEADGNGIRVRLWWD